jgi:CheY-like chemotaxis protein
MTKEQYEPPGGSLRGTVLVADDDADVRELLVLYLSKMGFQVHAVADGGAAVSVLNGAAPIDLVCTDIMMPGGLTGYGVADAAVARRPGIRVMFVSGYLGTGRAHGQQRHSRAPMLQKPFKREDVVTAVLEALKPH